MAERVQAPELEGETGWLNAAGPVRLRDLRGKVVLLDFWTYGCINCRHVFPDLRRLEKKYGDALAVVGIHSAKFSTEKDAANLRKAILRHGVDHPVANDGEFVNWGRYGIRGWPTLVVIDPEGYLVGGVSGEGHYELLEQVVGRTLAEHEKKGTLDRTPVRYRREEEETGLLAFPGKLCARGSPPRLFVSDTNHHRLLEVAASGQVLSVIGSGRAGFEDGAYEACSFFQPQGLACSGGTLFVADTENHAIRAVDLAARRVSTLAGTGERARGGAGGGPGRKTALNSPWDLALDKHRLFIAMAGDHRLWVLDLGAKGSVRPYAGSGREDLLDGPLDEAAFAQPSGLAVGGGFLFVADSEVSAIRATDLHEKGLVSTVVGEGLFEFGDRDGRGALVRLQHPLACLYHAGRLFVADTFNHKLKELDPEEKTSATFAGDGQPGFVDGERARFHEPGGLAVLGDQLYVADTNNHAVRVCDLATRAVSTLVLAGLES
ncbi:MAG: redoxin domain-containing protein [Planctomycetes bacterium]|nr:redoxin domain-containing protein [Planctomycetota bacterium]